MERAGAAIPSLAPRRLVRQFRRRSWITPRTIQIAYVVIAVGLGIFLPRADVGPGVNAPPVASFLFSVGAGVIAFVGLIYSSLILVIQFSTTAYTARLNLFREDSPVVYHTFGLLIGLGSFCFTAALSLGGHSETNWLVPGFVILMLVVVLAALQRLRTVSVRSLQLSSILADIVTRGLNALESIYQRVPGSGSVSPNQQISLQEMADAVEVRWPNRVAVLQVIDLPGSIVWQRART